MSFPILLLILAVCLAASTAGAICGIGGGVIIKPVIDTMQIMTAQQISFLSGCTVLCMSAYSVLSSMKKGSVPFKGATVLPLGIGAALGGLAGKIVFSRIARGSSTATAIQSACLFILLVGTLVYTVCQKRIKTHRVDNPVISALIGLFLGFFSSFLGIGGGPFNLVALSFFFSMDTKTAARYSLCVILISQLAALLYSFISATVPDVSPAVLAVMAAGGILGGVIGRRINRRISGEDVHKLFIVLTVVIMGICLFNILRNTVFA